MGHGFGYFTKGDIIGIRQRKQNGKLPNIISHEGNTN